MNLPDVMPEDLRAIEAAILGEPYVPENLSPRAASVVPPLVQRLVREWDQLRAEIEELRLALAAERGDPAGAPDPAWTWMGDGWEREYPCGERAAVYRKRWYRAVSGKPARVFGESPNLRAGMISCDAAFPPLAIPCPTCDAPADERCRDLPPRNVPDRDGNHDHVGRILPEPHPARIAAVKAPSRATRK